MQKSIKVTEPARLELSKMQASDIYAWWPDKAGDSSHPLTLCPAVLALHLFLGSWFSPHLLFYLVASLYCFVFTDTLKKVGLLKKFTEEKVQSVGKEFTFHIQPQNNPEVSAFVGDILMLCSRPIFKTYNGWFAVYFSLSLDFLVSCWKSSILLWKKEIYLTFFISEYESSLLTSSDCEIVVSEFKPDHFWTINSITVWSSGLS